ncbi:MAG: hypothetical protein WA704_09530, partial [Pseudolabrys sp.]
WHFVNALVLRSAGAKRSKNMWHAPDTILVGHENVVVLPSESITGSVIPLESEIARALLSDQKVAVGQGEHLGSRATQVHNRVVVYRL